MELKFEYERIQVELNLKSRVTILSGDSGTGKSYLYNTVKNFSVENDMGDNILCIDIGNYQLVGLSDLRNRKNSIIFIDQADDILEGELYDFYYNDHDNYYVIIGRSFANGVDQLARPVIKGKHIGIKYLTEDYRV